MNDRNISITTSRLTTIALWATAAALLIAAWIVHFATRSPVAALLGFTACSALAAAVVSHVRCIALKAVRVIVTAQNMRSNSASSVRPVR